MSAKIISDQEKALDSLDTLVAMFHWMAGLGLFAVALAQHNYIALVVGACCWAMAAFLVHK